MTLFVLKYFKIHYQGRKFEHMLHMDDPEHRMLSETAQSHKGKYCPISLCKVSRIVKFKEIYSRVMVARS